MNKIALAAALALVACGDDSGGDGTTGDPPSTGSTTATTAPPLPTTGDTTAGPDTTSGSTTEGDDTGTTGDATDGSDSSGTTGPGVDPVERGQYLVDHVGTCGACHTPLGNDGQPDMTRYLAGNTTLFDLDPGDPAVGFLPVPNLTPHETGLGGWTANEIRAAFQDGLDHEGNALAFVMPYYAFHNLTDDDADAIVAYLQSIEPIDNEIPERQPLPFPTDDPVQPVPWEQMPLSTLAEGDPDYDAAQRGRYLAGAAAGCHECHTPLSMGPVPVEMSLSFAGGRTVGPGVSANITPHPDGIAAYGVEDIVDVLYNGVERDGDAICPPMPFGMGGFGGLTMEDAEAIAIYLTTLPPVDNGVHPECTP